METGQNIDERQKDLGEAAWSFIKIIEVYADLFPCYSHQENILFHQAGIVK